MNQPITAEAAAFLTAKEQQRLTRWSQAYIIAGDSDGQFTMADARRLLFTRYLVNHGRLSE